MIPILQLRKLRLKEVKLLARDTQDANEKGKT
jgi:hypothetical protein